MSAIIVGSKAKQTEKVGLEHVATLIDTEMRNQGKNFASEQDGAGVASMESLGAAEKGRVAASLQEHAVSLENMFKEANIDLTTAQVSAGAVIAMAAGSPVKYAGAAYKTLVTSQEGVNVVHPDGGGQFGGYGFAEKLDSSLEAFDNSNLTDFLGISIRYNVQAARQDAFGEGFFRTVVGTPDNGGVDLSIRNQLVFNHFLHQVDGTPANFNQKRLLDAAVNYKILSDESTTLMPEVLEDNSNAQFFVPASAVAPRSLDLGNRTVRTAPLKIGKRVDLIGISSNNLIKKNGTPDNTDSLDRMTGLKSVYMQVADGDVIRFDVANLPRSYFVKGPEGNARVQVLNFNTHSIQLNEKTTLNTGGVPTNATLKEIVDSKLIVQLNFTLTGDVNTEYGNIIVNGGAVEVGAVYNAAKEKLSLTDGLGKQIVDGLAELEVIGWDPAARLSNANRRERGLQLNNQEYVERYPIPLGPPMSIPSPLAENRDAGEMNGLIAATRLRNSNNAVTKLLNYCDELERWLQVPDLQIEDNVTPEIEGIARFLINPWFRHLDLHLPDHINSLTSTDRVSDIQAVIVNALRDGVYDAYRDSNIQTALDMLTGYSGEKIKVLIGTDSVTSRYIVTPGDTRTLGDGLDFVKVATQDKRVYGDIYYTFTREGDGIDPLNFGTHLWIPELISNVQVARGNAQIREAMVQNRSRQVVHLPILGRIRITGLSEVVKDQTQFPVDTGATAPAGQGPTGGQTGGAGAGGGNAPAATTPVQAPTAPNP